ncbi:N-acetylmuramoyl-L-alanine amidase [Puniceicoccales bacterium CK1056]|uniref:N-acetylmuramoyl-L-alanine amidase n=1 Tax=Oceanipulchritudo coccoides TaxID=2706888 RepID=A0A6B2M2B3_9BACT|nr:N-acetylmuramoyl-L-alanine amidase [Oceanipulchritudo coccoides]NDV62217.1 N-acetylmuramoyl-L-alanine amidase [Oceanipulchritudo coccoides]
MAFGLLVSFLKRIHREGVVALLAIFFVCIPLCALELNGVNHLQLDEIGAKLGMQSRWVEKGKIKELKSEWTRLRFELHKREMIVNGLRVHLGFPVAGSRGKLYLSETDFRHQIQPILTPQVFGKPPGFHHIIIDAGHGGTDPGAENPALKLREKSLTLDLAKRLKAQLEKAGYKVTLTRSGDRLIALPERALMANRLKGDLFLSLHFNASGKSSVHGVETYAFTPLLQPSTSRGKLHPSDRKSYPGNKHDPWNELLGFYVQRSLKETLPSPDRGLKRARFTVLRDLNMPGLLIEGGFVSHSQEGRNIGSAAYREKIARAIASGLATFEKTANRLKGKAQ